MRETKAAVVSRETSEDADSLGDASSQPDTVSIASRTSQNTADSDKVNTQGDASEGREWPSDDLITAAGCVSWCASEGFSTQRSSSAAAQMRYV